jgi:protocatechuate 3,4-dioxygenase, alpha subunit
MRVPRPATPAQTIGPFFRVAISAPGPARLAPEDVPPTILQGRVLDGDGEPVDDALVEVWDVATRRFARCHTDTAGRFSFLVADDGSASGYLALWVFARGLLTGLATRCYLSDSDADDAALAAVPRQRRHTLVAERTDEGYRLDLRLQGDRETVFFAF